jgi:3-oxoacyl-[acyl-carrier-protein] synthase-3
MAKEICKKARIAKIAYYLPEKILNNAELALAFPEWTESAILDKLGIKERKIAGENETSTDLAVQACKKFFIEHQVNPEEIQALIFCTQSPDYFLPTSACLIQARLGLSNEVLAFDFNLGCSGFVYGLGLAKGLIESGQVRNAMLVTAETYSKFIDPKDKSVRTLFGDAAAVTYIEEKTETTTDELFMGPFVYGTNGLGAENLIVSKGAFRHPYNAERGSSTYSDKSFLFMNGPEIFNFTLNAVPKCLMNLLEKAQLTIDEIDLFIFHQANKYMLENLRRKCGIPKSKFVFEMEDCGNTVASTIPIAIYKALKTGQAKRGMRVATVGFGVGYSWAGAILKI